MIPSCQEIFYRVFGAWLLARLDATGAQYFDESPQAALRSFFAALLVAPAVTVTVLFAHGEVPPVGALAVIVVTLLCYCLLWTAYPLIAYRVCQTIDREQAFYRYLSAHNWSNVIADHFQLVVIILMVGLVPEALMPLVELALWACLLAYAWFVARSCLKVSGMAAAGFVVLQAVVGLFINIIAVGILYPSVP
ncbi:MAG TPA: hypothetical protein VIS03_11295 [Kiloniellaceae bacterium]